MKKISKKDKKTHSKIYDTFSLEASMIYVSLLIIDKKLAEEFSKIDNKIKEIMNKAIKKLKEEK